MIVNKVFGFVFCVAINIFLKEASGEKIIQVMQAERRYMSRLQLLTHTAKPQIQALLKM